ncbi:MAG: hypothetical protein F9K38_07020 [Pseudorhodoplanes sp.]|nr:MAG: hypothetical protein F9K38_07020 [Pseudorhodoplanes sp.]
MIAIGQPISNEPFRTLGSRVCAESSPPRRGDVAGKMNAVATEWIAKWTKLIAPPAKTCPIMAAFRPRRRIAAPSG